MNRTRLLSLALLSTTLFTGLAAAQGGAAIPLRTSRIATGLTFPTNVVFAPGDNDRVFLTEKRGTIRIFKQSTSTLLPAILDIDPIVGGGTTQNNEQGLLGLAFHPDWQTNGYVYLYYTNNAGGTVVARYTMDPNNPEAPINTGTALQIITFTQPFTNHNGGWIGFGPSGYLYIASGDGGSANDPGNRAQQIVNQKLGKMLRLDVNGDDFPADPTRNYAIPPENPFVGMAGDDEILHYGLRNPWRSTFDRATGDLYIADVGQNAREEVNVAPAGSAGLNFGWRCMEGNLCTGLSGCTCMSPSLTMPIHWYDHGPTGGISITGGLVYRGCEIPEADGTYFFVDYGTNRYWSVKWNGSSATEFTVQTSKFTPTLEGLTSNLVVAWGENHDGEMYYVRHGGGTGQGWLYRVVRDPSADPLPDCNGNGQPDTCDIARGDSLDLNGNGIPDECEPVPGDLNGDGIVDGADLGIMLGAWGECDGCDEDLNGDGTVDGGDLGVLLGNWT